MRYVRFFLVLLMALYLAGCGTVESSATLASSDVSSPPSGLLSTSSTVSRPRPSDGAEDELPTLDIDGVTQEFIHLYSKMEIWYEWYYSDARTDWDAQLPKIPAQMYGWEGDRYQTFVFVPVNRYHTLSELTEDLYTIWLKSYADEMVSANTKEVRPVFMEIDGRLYVVSISYPFSYVAYPQYDTIVVLENRPGYVRLSIEQKIVSDVELILGEPYSDVIKMEEYELCYEDGRWVLGGHGRRVSR